MSLSNQQAQELMDVIVDKCEELELSSEEIIDGIGRSLISATMAFKKSSAIVNIEGHGTAVVAIVN